MAAPTITGMALTVGDRAVRPLTADEVLRMVELGILSEDEPVELLHVVLTAVTPQSVAHVAVLQRLQRWLAPLVVAGAHDVRIQVPLAVPDRTSLPEPDVAVVERDDSLLAHPTSALLVIEVAVSSLRTDTRIKLPLYALAGVPELWVVDIDARRVRVFADARDGSYASEVRAGPDGLLRPAALDIGALDLARLFAGL
jgi:Uma2 family endonuclease